MYYCTNGDEFGIAARSKSDQTFTVSSTAGLEEVSYVPSWYSACGAFDMDDSDPNRDFAYTFDGDEWGVYYP